jgi:sensor domain CHASE-containing protein
MKCQAGRFRNPGIFSNPQHSRCFTAVCGEIFSRSHFTMTTPSQAIEVEVVEIDGAAPPAKFDKAAEASAPRQSWQMNWQGRVRKLDSRWWPLWVLLGVVAVTLLLTVGLVLGIVFVVFRILRGLVRAIVR